MLLTDTVAWCWWCGASACARVRSLARPCLGRPRGFLVQARQRLLLGPHPSTRVPLGAVTVPEPGRSMPGGFGNAVRRVEASATTAASSRRVPGPGMAASCAPPLMNHRIGAVRARVRAREAAAAIAMAGVAPAAKKRRLWGKQPPLVSPEGL